MMNDELVDLYWQGAHQPNAHYAPASFLGMSLNLDVRSALPAMPCPFLLAWGRDAGQTPLKEADAVRALRPNDPFVVLPGGDLPHEESPSSSSPPSSASSTPARIPRPTSRHEALRRHPVGHRWRSRDERCSSLQARHGAPGARGQVPAHARRPPRRGRYAPPRPRHGPARRRSDHPDSWIRLEPAHLGGLGDRPREDPSRDPVRPAGLGTLPAGPDGHLHRRPRRRPDEGAARSARRRAGHARWKTRSVGASRFSSRPRTRTAWTDWS